MTNCGVEILPDELQNELQKIAYGACFLGSGGGGGIETSFNYIDKYCQGGINNNLEITDLNTAQGSGIVVAYMGAPQKVGDVKCPDAICAGIDRFKKYKRIDSIDYIIPIEIGPVSMVTACLAAHRMGIPVLDVDGAGRAVPTLDLITYGTNAKTSVNPTILCSEYNEKSEDHGFHQIALEISNEKNDPSGDASKMETLARHVLSMPLFDQKAGLVMWYFPDVTVLREPYACVPGTLTFCQKLGDAIQSKPKDKEFLPYIKELFESQSIYPAIKENYIREMCRGKLISATTSTAGGFDVGVITIKDEGVIARHYTIIFQNESLILWDSLSAIPLIMAPDLISYLIEEKPFTNGDIMRGDALKEELHKKEIVVYGIAAPNALKTFAMQSNTMKVLNTLGYYGQYKSLKE